jgi:hypothetical protein
MPIYASGVAGLPTQVLDGAELDFSRYGDTLFEVFFVGGRLATGGSVATEGKRTSLNVSPAAALGSLCQLAGYPECWQGAAGP